MRENRAYFSINLIKLHQGIPMLYSLRMAKLINLTTVVAPAADANWPAISPACAKSSYRSDWTNKRSNKGFYTFTSDRTPGSYIG